MHSWWEKIQDEFLVRRRAADLWELSRPFTLLAPFFGFASGAMIASGADSSAVWMVSGFVGGAFSTLLGSLSAAVLNAANNTVNQIFDLDIDRVNKPMRPIPSGRVSVTRAWIFAAGCYVLSLLLALLVPNPQYLWIWLFTAFLTYAYSGPPFRTKRFPWLSNLTMAIPRGGLIIVAGWAGVRDVWSPEPWFIALILALYVFGASSTKDYSDIEGDRAHGVRTLPIIYGVRESVYLIAPFFVLPFMLYPYGSIFGLLTAPARSLAMLSAGLTLYGMYTLYLIVRKPEELATEANHVSWKHMYLLLVFAQLGAAVCYVWR